MILKNTTTQGLKPNPQTGRGGATRRRKKQIPPASLRSRVGMTRLRAPNGTAESLASLQMADGFLLTTGN